MIKHIVMFKFKPTANGKAKADNLALAMLNAKKLEKEIDCKISIKPVFNAKSSDERNYDFALLCEFESIEQLEQYKVHPAHVAFGKFITPLRESRACIDYEV